MRLMTLLGVNLTAALLASHAHAQTFVPGDINSDGTVNVQDATVLRRSLALLGPGISQTCPITCGNGVFDPGEQCELGTLGGASCTALGFGGGTLGCTPGSCLWDTTACTGSLCSPANPAPVCGAGAHCLPQVNGAAYCNAPVGAGTQGSFCSGTEQCAAPYGCLDTGGGSGQCLKWCPTTGPSGCPGGLTCFPLDPALFSGTTQYGVCF